MVHAEGHVYGDYRVCGWVEARPDQAASAASADTGDDGKRDDLADALPRQPASREAPLEPVSPPHARRA